MKFQPWSGIATVLEYIALYNFIIASSHPICFSRVQDLRSPPPPRPNSFRFPTFHPLTPFRYLFAPSSPPQLAWARSDHLPGRHPHLLASTVRLRFPPLIGGLKEFLTRACDCYPLSGCPPFAVFKLCPGPCQPQGFSRLRVPSSLCLTLSPVCLLPPLPALADGPVPCQYRGVCVMFFCPPSLVYTPLPPRVPRRLLVSSGE